MEPWNCHGRFFQMQMSPARLHSAFNVGRQEANALLYRSRRTVECRWIVTTSPETAMIPSPLTNHPCQRIVASQVQTTSCNSVSKPLPPTCPVSWQQARKAGHAEWRAVRLDVWANHCHPAADQSSTASPGTLTNSRVLAVTSVKPRQKAWPAMRTSNGPIGLPEA